MSKVGVPLIKIFLKNTTGESKMWVEYSNHFSIADARKVANQLVTRYGADHIMICQVIDTVGAVNII